MKKLAVVLAVVVLSSTVYSFQAYGQAAEKVNPGKLVQEEILRRNLSERDNTLDAAKIEVLGFLSYLADSQNKYNLNQTVADNLGVFVNMVKNQSLTDVTITTSLIDRDSVEITLSFTDRSGGMMDNRWGWNDTELTLKFRGENIARLVAGASLEDTFKIVSQEDANIYVSPISIISHGADLSKPTVREISMDEPIPVKPPRS